MFEVASRQIFEFGEFRLDATRRLLTKNGEPVPLTHKAFETLALLVEHRGRVVTKEELLSEIWPDTFVEEGSLARNISVLRKALGEHPGEHQFIQTIPKQGYRFVAPVRETFEPVELPSTEPHKDNGNGVHVTDSTAVHTTDSADASPRNPMPWAIAAGVLAATLITIAAFFLATRVSDLGNTRSVFRELNNTAPASFNVTRFTATGKALDAAISRDGKYVVYVQLDGAKQSLWVKQVASGSVVRIVEPADVFYQGLAFTADGGYVFYNVWDKQHVGEIYKIPVLGGPATRVVNDVMPSISVSPDSSEIVFVRSNAKAGESYLMAAKTDGSGERIVATRGKPNVEGWFGGPAWSPDGGSIAFALGGIGEEGQSYVRLASVPAAGGEIRILSERQFLGVGTIAWHSNGRDIIASASDQLRMPNQIWRIDAVSGEARRLTNDVNGYLGISLTADSRSLVATQGDFQSNVYVGGEAAGSEWKRVTAGRYEGSYLTFAPDGRILFVSQESGNDDIWIMNADGSGRKRLTTDPSIDAWPAVANDGRTVIFASLRTGVPHLFRMSIDGGDAVQLTDGPGDWGPTTSPTEPFVLFFSSNEKGIWKMNIDGSGRERLDLRYSYLPAISPDGARVAYSYWDDQSKPEQLRQAIYDLRTGTQTLLPPLPKTAIRQDSQVILKWSPDGKSIAYVDDRDGVSNIWRQPIAGGPAQKMTNFNDSFIFWFDWSRDGRLAAARGTINFDVVLITNFE
jgi:Tol biopolymer transport system component/DNA-binding winged helix-turn-helix (wHTH) protein